jgi:hypothetical protein
MSANDREEFSNQDTNAAETVYHGTDTVDNSYATQEAEAIPVVKDEDVPADQAGGEDPDSDKALGTLFLPNSFSLPSYIFIPNPTSHPPF